MQEFEKKDYEIIKTLQQIIVKNTAVLDRKTRSKVYSRFQSVGYSYIDSEEAKKFGVNLYSIAFYSSKTNRIYIIKDRNKILEPEVLMHEMIHSISDSQEWDVSKNTLLYKSGIIQNLTIIPEKVGEIYTINRYNIGINEGITEFINSKFLDNKTIRYIFEVNITNLLSDEIGYDNLLNCYFNNDPDKLKALIQNAFHLPNQYLIDKLFMQIDVFCNLSKTNINKYDAIPVIRNCYETLLKMNIIKTQQANKSKIKNKEDVFNYFNIRQYLSQHDIDLSIEWFNYLIIDDLVKNQFHLLNNLEDTEGYNNINSISTYIVQSLRQNQSDKLSGLGKSGKTCVKVIQKLNSFTDYAVKNNGQMELVKKNEIENKFLSLLLGKDGKINFEHFTDTEKYEFILNSLYGPYDGDKENYKYFHPKDLVDFINYGNTEYKYFISEKPFIYISNYLNKINCKIFYKKDFYQNIEKYKSALLKYDKEL